MHEPDRGVDFVHTAGYSAPKYVPEVMGAGAAWLDYDRDGRWDLYLVDSGVLAGVAPLTTPRPDAGTNRLYRGNTARFDEVDSSGLEDRGYGMGAAAADYDNDGWIDVLVTNYGADRLFRNNGDGTFSDASDLLAGNTTRWGASAAWGDLDNDGWLDLYVTNYLTYDLETVPLCNNLDKGVRQYCPPQRLDGASDQLFRNLSGTGFTEITATAGVDNAADGKGLAVVIVDLNADGRADIYVANDSTANFHYLNSGDLTFAEQGLVTGTGLNDLGQPQSGMGIDVGDLNLDGGNEVAVTNFIREPVNLYSEVAPSLFMDSSFRWGVGEPTLDTLGFGVAFLDAEGDGDLDLVVANGHILDDHEFFAQPNQVFRNNAAEGMGIGQEPNPLFTDVTSDEGNELAALHVSRALAVGDYNDDGAPDLIVSNNNGPARLFRNASSRNGGRLSVRLRGRAANRDAVGAAVRVTPVDGGPTRVASVLSGVSYLSRHADDLYFGIGGAGAADLEITWPDGTSERVSAVARDQAILIEQGRGATARRDLVPPR